MEHQFLARVCEWVSDGANGIMVLMEVTMANSGQLGSNYLDSDKARLVWGRRSPAQSHSAGWGVV